MLDIISTYKKLLFLLSPSERREFMILTFMIFILSIIELIGIGSIFPFIALISNPQAIESNILLSEIYQYALDLGITNSNEFTFYIGVLVFVLLVSSISLRAFITYSQIKYIERLRFNMSRRLIESYLHQPYSWFASQHSADLGRKILIEVGNVIMNGFNSLLELIARVMISFFIISLLVYLTPKISIILATTLGSIYILFYILSRSYTRKLGQSALDSNQSRFTTVSEGFRGIKEMKLSRLENVYLRLFSKYSDTFAKSETHSQIINQLPKFILEATIFGGLIFVLLFMMKTNVNFIEMLPSFSLFIFAAYRIAPSFNQIYSSINKISYVNPIIDKLYSDFNKLKILDKAECLENIIFDKSITLKNIHYRYPESTNDILENINLEIAAKSTIGIIGTTGSGKTTTVDIILGLLEPQKGTLEIDKKVIAHENLISWQKMIGYVPQKIHLIGDTIAANIAFGVPADEIDMNAVKRAAEAADLDGYINNYLPEKYTTYVGEQGIKLSGGQCQRIGIARAIYRNPQVIVLDEATNSLDEQTERTVINNLHNLHDNLTIIMISHRYSSLDKCEQIYQVEGGRIIKETTFKDLISKKITNDTPHS
tara:strand:+ start:3213 stop:5012 length:1800 start_codon:yes stop_codon:yes gene_type:complete